MNDQIKICRKCGEEKSLTEFPSDKSKKDGRRNDCKDCFNAYIKGLRAVKKATVKIPEKDQRNITKDENNTTLDKEIVKELDIFLKENNNSGRPETDPLKSIREKITNIRDKSKFKPTNEIYIIEAIIDGCSDTRANMEIIKSKLSLFLAIRRKKINVDIEVVKDRQYETNPTLIATLPSDIILSYEEVIDFKKSLMKPKEKKLNSFEIKIEDVNTLGRTGKIINLVEEFLSKEFSSGAKNLCFKYLHEEKTISVDWLEEYSIEHKKMTELKDIIQDSLNMDIFYK